MTLELTKDECELLAMVLNGRLGDLRQEIHHSTVSTYTDELKQTEILLKGIITKIQADDAGSSGE